jgi:hypothetical protein
MICIGKEKNFGPLLEKSPGSGLHLMLRNATETERFPGIRFTPWGKRYFQESFFPKIAAVRMQGAFALQRWS